MGVLSILTTLTLPAIAPIAGFLLGKFTKEELKAGKKYFITMQHVLFITIATVFLYANKWNLYIVVAGLAVMFAYLIFKKARNPFLSEALFGITFAFAVNTRILFLLSSMIFLYGLPTGSLFVRQKKGIWKATCAGLLFAILAWGTELLL